MIQEELEKKLYDIGKQIHEIFPEVHGSIRFNLKPGREPVNINFEESKFLTKTK